jgi:hypothetical protein
MHFRNKEPLLFAKYAQKVYSTIEIFCKRVYTIVLFQKRVIWAHSICSSFEMLADESRYLSQAEQIHKVTTIFTQNDNYVSF